MSSSHDYTVTYEDLESALAGIGGAQGLLVMLPAMVPNLPASVLEAVELGIVEQEPVDVSVKLPGGITYSVHLRAAAPSGQSNPA